ncbi:MAG TPA: SigB/SigF/SigG family RNA polymerase sigma factor [Clostridia bacterium]|nr:SigB/SigF/SigG family RNA polymerase sigma factor [Clostridia bacterium]
MHKVEISGVNTSTLPKLTAKQSEELMKRISQGDEEAREEFLYANMRLVLSIIGRFSRSTECSDDLFQVGCVGLLKALNNFDFSLNVRFSTYAVPMIIGEIKRFLRDHSGVKVSRNVRDVAYKAFKIRENLMANNTNGEPSLFEIASELDIDSSEIACALDAVSEPVSFFEPVYSDGEESMLLLDQLSDEKDTADNWMENLSLTEALKYLPEKEREVLEHRYYQGKTQIEISKIVDISQAQVSRLEKNAIEKLRKVLN